MARGCQRVEKDASLEYEVTLGGTSPSWLLDDDDFARCCMPPDSWLLLITDGQISQWWVYDGWY
jgi:hypothetical protein